MQRDEALAFLNATALNLGTGVTVIEGSKANDDDYVSGIGAPADGVACEIIGFHDGIAQMTDEKGKVTGERSFIVIDLLGKDGAPYRVNMRKLTINKSAAAKHGFLGKFSAVKTKLTDLNGRLLTITRTVREMDEDRGYQVIRSLDYVIE